MKIKPLIKAIKIDSHSLKASGKIFGLLVAIVPSSSTSLSRRYHVLSLGLKMIRIIKIVKIIETIPRMS